MIFLTNDPSLTAWGYAILDTKYNMVTPPAGFEDPWGVIKTHAGQYSTNKPLDRLKRIQHIAYTLRNLCEIHNVHGILSEPPCLLYTSPSPRD